jgi:hypothetical protein
MGATPKRLKADLKEPAPALDLRALPKKVAKEIEALRERQRKLDRQYSGRRLFVTAAILLSLALGACALRWPTPLSQHHIEVIP